MFFFQAEDGIRDYDVTGVQTCALPICQTLPSDIAYYRIPFSVGTAVDSVFANDFSTAFEIGRASCRERV